MSWLTSTNEKKLLLTFKLANGRVTEAHYANLKCAMVSKNPYVQTSLP